MLNTKHLCWFIGSYFYVNSKRFTNAFDTKVYKTNFADELINILKDSLTDNDIRLIKTFIKGDIDELKNERYDFELAISYYFIPVLTFIYNKLLWNFEHTKFDIKPFNTSTNNLSSLSQKNASNISISNNSTNETLKASNNVLSNNDASKDNTLKYASKDNTLKDDNLEDNIRTLAFEVAKNNIDRTILFNYYRIITDMILDIDYKYFTRILLPNNIFKDESLFMYFKMYYKTDINVINKVINKKISKTTDEQQSNIIIKDKFKFVIEQYHVYTYITDNNKSIRLD